MDEDYSLPLLWIVAAGYSVPSHGVILATLADKDKEEGLFSGGFAELGFGFMVTRGRGTAGGAGISAEVVNKIGRAAPIPWTSSGGQGGPGDQHPTKGKIP